jgi:hypothetical protein
MFENSLDDASGLASARARIEHNMHVKVETQNLAPIQLHSRSPPTIGAKPHTSFTEQ